MAHIGKPRGKDGRIPVSVRKAGHAPVHRTFAKKTEATIWARDIEAAIDRGSNVDYGALRSTLVRDLIVRFRDEVTPNRKGWKWETNRLNAYLTESWSLLDLTQDLPVAIRDWRDRRLTEVTAATVNRDFNLLGSVFTHAAKEWNYGVENPIHKVKRPKVVGGKRDVIWSEAEYQEFLEAFGFSAARPPARGRDYTLWVLVLLRVTGLRLGSLCKLRIAQIHLDVPMIDFEGVQLKNDEQWKCPLGTKAVEMLRVLIAHRGPEERLIPHDENSIGQWYREMRTVLEAANPRRRLGLRIHDLRHTWTTALVNSGKVRTELELMRITGRKDMKSLSVYFNPQVKDLAKLLD